MGTGAGVRALFTGASGTGKTLAARVLGAQLGLDVYRVDLAAIVNKYVGETEKNLHRVLSTAEELDVVLLIDEGDSLLGRRTEVRIVQRPLRQPRDQLPAPAARAPPRDRRGDDQRGRPHRPGVPAADGRGGHVPAADAAGAGRDLAAAPARPDHLVPAEHLVELATRCAMTGGQIRNAVIHAVLLALEDGPAGVDAPRRAGRRQRVPEGGRLVAVRPERPA